MTTDNITITIADQTIEINAEVLAGYKDEAFGYLQQIDEHKESFKEVVATAAETTGIPKAIVGKYFKARFQDKTKETTEAGKVFEQLDEALEA